MTSKKKELEEKELKNHRILCSLIILVVCFCLGVFVVSFGLYIENKAKEKNIHNEEVATKTASDNLTKAKNRTEEIDKELDTLNLTYDKKMFECDSMSSSVDKTTCTKEATQIKEKIISLEVEKNKLETADYSVSYSVIDSTSYQAFYILGAVIVFLGCLAALLFYIIQTKKDNKSK